MKTFLGVDIGGTKIFAGRFLSDGHCVKSKTTSSRGNAQKFFTHLFEAIDATILEEHDAIHIAFAGPIFEGKILAAPNIPFIEEIRNFPEILTEKYRKPVTILNDAHAFARGEAKLRNARNLVGVTIGTGVGVGLFLNGEIFSGAHGFAGEIGHTSSCLIGGKGKIEDFLRAHSFTELGHEEYFTAAANFFTHLILHFDPEIIAIGGGFGRHEFPVFLEKMTKEISKKLLQRNFELKTKIIVSIHENAGAFGAKR